MKCIKRLLVISFIILTMGAVTDAFGFLGFGNWVSWKEEVLLHDGRIIIVKRSRELGGYRFVDSRNRAVMAEKWVIPVPGTKKKVVWEVDFHSPPKGDSLMLITVGFLNGTPYIATKPAGINAYNYWKRPNPPYIFFKYVGKEWQQIPLAEFPGEFKEANVVVGSRSDPEEQAGKTLTIDQIKYENQGVPHYLLHIIREPITEGDGPWKEPVLEYKGNGRWESPGGFKAPLPIPKRPDLPEGWD